MNVSYFLFSRRMMVLVWLALSSVVELNLLFFNMLLEWNKCDEKLNILFFRMSYGWLQRQTTNQRADKHWLIFYPLLEQTIFHEVIKKGLGNWKDVLQLSRYILLYFEVELVIQNIIFNFQCLYRSSTETLK